MIQTTPNTQTLKLHVSNGKVWYLQGALEYPRCTGLSTEDFLEQPMLQQAEHIRVVGSQANVKLLLRLYDLKQKGIVQSVEVCTPLICRIAKQRSDPQAVLLAMQEFSRAPSLGGFHEFVESDYRAYALTSNIADNVLHGSPVTTQTLRLLRAHPAWRALSFVTSLNKAAVAGLLGYILDPRWYVDECKPNSINKLQRWLGLTPSTQAGVTGKEKRGRYHNRCLTVMHCWKDIKLADVVRKRFELAPPPQPVQGCELTGYAPCDFAWRVWGSKMQFGMEGEQNANPVIADLHASQKFLYFVRQTWLSEIYRDARGMPEQGAALFRPADFFKFELEVAEYELHQLRTGMI